MIKVQLHWNPSTGRMSVNSPNRNVTLTKAVRDTLIAVVSIWDDTKAIEKMDDALWVGTTDERLREREIAYELKLSGEDWEKIVKIGEEFDDEGNDYYVNEYVDRESLPGGNKKNVYKLLALADQYLPTVHHIEELEEQLKAERTLLLGMAHEIKAAYYDSGYNGERVIAGRLLLQSNSKGVLDVAVFDRCAEEDLAD